MEHLLEARIALVAVLQCLGQAAGFCGCSVFGKQEDRLLGEVHADVSNGPCSFKPLYASMWRRDGIAASKRRRGGDDHLRNRRCSGGIPSTRTSIQLGLDNRLTPAGHVS